MSTTADTAPQGTAAAEEQPATAPHREITAELLRAAATVDAASWSGRVGPRTLAVTLGVDLRTARRIRTRLDPLRKRGRDRPSLGAPVAIVVVALMLAGAMLLAVSI